MAQKICLLLITPLFFIMCNEVIQTEIKKSKSKDNAIVTNQITYTFEVSPNDIKQFISTDSIYEKKCFMTISQLHLNEDSIIFSFYNLNKTKIYTDTINNNLQEIIFQDYNNDGIKDILIQTDIDVRGNINYNLYLVFQDNLIKIKQFNTIKNPNYLTEKKVIISYVVSGTNYLKFYTIQKDSIVTHDIIIYDNLNTNDNTFDKNYDKAIEIITKKQY